MFKKPPKLQNAKIVTVTVVLAVRKLDLRYNNTDAEHARQQHYRSSS